MAPQLRGATPITKGVKNGHFKFKILVKQNELDCAYRSIGIINRWRSF